MIVYLSLLVCIIGLIIYLATDKGKIVDIGRLMFSWGLLVFLLQSGLSTGLRLFGK